MYTQPAEIHSELVGTSYTAEQNGCGACETILLVEDEGFVREVTGEVLVSAGYRVLTAINSSEAVAIYEKRRGEVDLLLTDVVLPGENGNALARILQRRNPSLVVLLMTGYGDQMAARETKYECLAKPFSGRVLIERVRQILDQKQDSVAQCGFSQACFR